MFFSTAGDIAEEITYCCRVAFQMKSINTITLFEFEDISIHAIHCVNVYFAVGVVIRKVVATETKLHQIQLLLTGTRFTYHGIAHMSYFTKSVLVSSMNP